MGRVLGGLFFEDEIFVAEKIPDYNQHYRRQRGYISPQYGRYSPARAYDVDYIGRDGDVYKKPDQGNEYKLEELLSHPVPFLAFECPELVPEIAVRDGAQKRDALKGREEITLPYKRTHTTTR